MKISLFLFCLLFNLQAICQSKDSVQIAKLSEKLENTIEQNKELKFKIDILNEANNKIISATYAIIAIILGIGIWNGIQSYKINNQKLQEITSSLQKDIDNKNITLIQKRFSEEGVKLESLSNKTKSEYLSINILLAKMCCASIPATAYQDINMETSNLSHLLRLSIEYYNTTKDTSEVKATLKYLIKYFNEYPDSIISDDYMMGSLKSSINSIQISDLEDLKESLIKKIRREVI